ncbi:MAG: hypothetical protein HYS18_10335 [Burkholderiales bacterium]|nr:hypothetical protein [Burkholderiales bacterium]
MKTGARFWQLIGLTFLILAWYGLAELDDAVTAKQKQLQDQRMLLTKQEDLLRDNQWKSNLADIEKVRTKWLAYIPEENSPALAKAHLLNELRSAAVNVGILNATVNATEGELEEQANSSVSGSTNSAYAKAGESKAKLLPSGLHVIKVNIVGRFDPAAFTKLVRVLEDERRFTVIERISVRGVQMDLNLRCYWRQPTTAKPTLK